ncbi:MAG TPA: serine/threonine-protein kinase [Pyrinomonadaceae bacterium]|jgi:serine/threonine protein kinase
MIEAGTILQNRYLIHDKIGAGGMGAVFTATDQRFGSQVAIKETFFSEAVLRRAFEREAQLLNSLRHPALPRVSDHFEEGNGQFLVMEYIAGEDLSEILERKGAFAVADVLLWADQLLDALDYLHSQKIPIIHRDIKPQNLKLTPRGQIVLLDFGLAKGSITDVSKLTQTKSVFGYSRAYAPLEQIQGTGTDPRSDLYSLAATVYHLLTGAAPVDALTRAMAVLNGGEDSLRPANELNPKVSRSAAAVLHRAMSLNPNLRPQTAAAMRRELMEAAENPDYAAPSPTENAATSAALFTQKTELMGGQTKDGNQTAANANLTAPLEAGFFAETKDSDATKFSRTNLEKQQFATNLHSAAQTDLEEAEAEKRNAAFKVPVETPTANNLNSNAAPQKNRPLFKAIGIAAAIAILAGGGFAGWYAMSGSNVQSDNFQPRQTQTVHKNEAQKPETSDAKQNANTAFVITPAPGAQQPANTAVKSTGAGINSVAPQNEAKPNTQTVILEKAEKGQSKPKTEKSPEIRVVVEESDIPDVDIPEIEVPDVRDEDLQKLTPEQREKIRSAVENARQLQKMRRLNDINKRRIEKGLPPIAAPPPPPRRRSQP